MASFLRSFLFCCLRRKDSHKLEEVDEESRLIPPPDPTPPPPPGVVVVDQQKLKAKLNTIVRSKEGKMVNVNARLPFNLHNKNLSHTLDAHTAASSSSRSASLSIHSLPKPSSSLSPLSSTPHTHTQVHAHVGAPLSFDPPTNASSTRSSSREGADLEVYTRSRILNLRLVHRTGAGRRGRSRIKYAEGEGSPGANSNGAAAPEGGAAGAFDPTEFTSSSAAHLPVPPIEVSALPPESGLYSPASTVMEGTPRATVPLLTSLSTSPQQSRPSVSINAPRTFDFKIKDTGALCISWGD